MENVSKLAVGKRIIGITGIAGSGKDTFFTLLSRKIPFVRYALADELKYSLRWKIFEKYGIDVISSSRAEKTIVRDELVSFAKQKRTESSGTYWTRLAENKILNSENKFICITDIRHNEYPEDEVYWLKNVLGGTLIDISRIDSVTGKEIDFPNEEERIQYPKVKSCADYFIQWPTVNDIKELDFYIDRAIVDLRLNENL